MLEAASFFSYVCDHNYNNKNNNNNNGEGKAIPLQAWTGPGGFQEVEDPRIQDSRHIKVVRLSALRTGRLYPQGNIPGTHFC